MSGADTLHIAEIPYGSGEVRFRYARYLSDDGSRWIRHGLFCAYWQDAEFPRLKTTRFPELRTTRFPRLGTTWRSAFTAPAGAGVPPPCRYPIRPTPRSPLTA